MNQCGLKIKNKPVVRIELAFLFLGTFVNLDQQSANTTMFLISI